MDKRESRVPEPRERGAGRGRGEGRGRGRDRNSPRADELTTTTTSKPQGAEGVADTSTTTAVEDAVREGVEAVTVSKEPVEHPKRDARPAKKGVKVSITSYMYIYINEFISYTI